MNKKSAKYFCVIGPRCGAVTHGYDRRWFTSEAAAVSHAEDILRANPGARPVLVVEVKKVIEITPRPIAARSPRIGEFG